MDSHLAAFCGDYCGKCPDYPHECPGCVAADHMDCRFVRCCLEKGLEHCGGCAVFPCENLARFVPDDRPGCPPGYHIAALRRRLYIGTDSWLQEQLGRW
jgi:hypothetical protein